MPLLSTDVQEHVFISYARSDGSQPAQKLERALWRAGFIPWRDTRDIDWSADFKSEIKNAIRDSLAVVLCVTPDVRQADFVKREIAFARTMNIPIIVARFANIRPLKSVRNNTYVDFYDSFEAGQAQLLSYLRRRNYRKIDFPRTDRNAYLRALNDEVEADLDEAIDLIITGRRMELLEATGLITGPKVSASGTETLSRSHFRPARRPIAGKGVRQALDYARQRLAIVGPPGSGKTTALMVLLRELIGEAIDDPDKPLPLYLSAATWGSDGTAEASLISWLAREEHRLAGWIADLIRSQQVILVIDGLDELPHLTFSPEGGERKYPRAELIRELPRSCPLVVASRAHEFQAAAADLGIRTVFELRPLTKLQVSAYVAQIPGAAAILEQDDDLRAAARTPLMLTLLCSALDVAAREEVGDMTPAEARDSIVEYYVKSRYERECAGQQGANTAPIPLEELYRSLGSLAMSDAGGGGNRNLFKIEEVQAVLGSEGAYSLLLATNIMVATRGGSLRFYHLALRDHFAYRFAQDAIHDRCSAVRDSAVWALWQIPDRRAIDLLLDALSDEDPYVRGGAASALGRIGDRRAIRPLNKLLTDDTRVASMYGNTIADVARWAIAQINQSE